MEEVSLQQAFRKIARKAGWPDDAWNMDSRAGAVSEAFEAGAQAGDVMKAASHPQLSTTMRYNRGKIVQASRVAQLRVARRLKSEERSGRPHISQMPSSISGPIELISFLGGLAGLGTAAFTIYDRLVRNRPIVSLVTLKDKPFLATDIFVRVKNPSDRDIIVTSITTNREPQILVGQHNSFRSIVYASMGSRSITVVEAKSVRLFPLQNIIDDDADLPVDITVNWRPITGRLFNRPPIVLRVSLGLLRQLEVEAEEREEEEKERAGN